MGQLHLSSYRSIKQKTGSRRRWLCFMMRSHSPGRQCRFFSDAVFLSKRFFLIKMILLVLSYVHIMSISVTGTSECSNLGRPQIAFYFAHILHWDVLPVLALLIFFSAHIWAGLKKSSTSSIARLGPVLRSSMGNSILAFVYVKEMRRINYRNRGTNGQITVKILCTLNLIGQLN